MYNFSVQLYILKKCNRVPSNFLSINFILYFIFFDSCRPGCPHNVMHIATRNLETLSEIIAIVNPSEAAVGVKRSHGDLI